MPFRTRSRPFIQTDRTIVDLRASPLHQQNFNYMIGKFLSAITASLLFTAANAQSYQWGMHYGGVGEDVVRAMTTDAAGNVYSVGYYTDNSDFDPGAGTTELVSNGFFDIYVQKLDTDGGLVWVKGIGGIMFDYATGVDADEAGNVYITGVYQETVDFDPGAGTFDLTSTGGEEVFILKLDVNGDFVWARSIGSPAYEEPTAVSVDGSGNVYVTGYFETPIDADPSEAEVTLTTNGAQDVFLVKLDQNGDLIWAFNVGGSEQDLALSMDAIATGGVVLAGHFNQTVDFDPGVSIEERTSNGQADAYVLRIGADGEFISVATFGGPQDVTAWGVDVDAAGDAFASGSFIGSITAADTTIAGNGPEDAFVVKVISNGDVQWLKAIQGADFQNAYDVHATSEGDVVIAGYFAATTDLDPSENELLVTVGSGEPFDAFYVLLDNDGGFISAGQFGGSNFLEHHGVSADANGNFYLAAGFQGDVDLDPDPDASAEAVAIDFRDSYVIKISSIPTSIPSLEEFGLSIHPNPATDRIFIELAGEATGMLYQIFDQQGRLVRSGQVDRASSIDVSKLDQGNYIVQLEGFGSMKWVKH